MKNHETEKPGPCRRNDGILYCCKHPEIDLNPRSPDAAYSIGPCAPGSGAHSEYAQDTTAWD